MNNNTPQTIGYVGMLIALFLSYFHNHSFIWAFLHMWCGWFYVAYNLCTFGLPHLPR